MPSSSACVSIRAFAYVATRSRMVKIGGQEVVLAGALIWFVCEAAEHRGLSHALRATDTPLTIHERQWAYCPAGGLSEHDWTPIAPVGLEYLKLRYAGWVVAEHPSQLDPHHGG